MTAPPGSFDTVIVGGGQAGAQVANSLRDRRYAGSIAMLEAGSYLPYERPPLTKAYLRGTSARTTRCCPPDFWQSVFFVDTAAEGDPMASMLDRLRTDSYRC